MCEDRVGRQRGNEISSKCKDEFRIFGKMWKR